MFEVGGGFYESFYYSVVESRGGLRVCSMGFNGICFMFFKLLRVNGC